MCFECRSGRVRVCAVGCGPSGRRSGWGGVYRSLRGACAGRRRARGRHLAATRAVSAQSAAGRPPRLPTDLTTVPRFLSPTFDIQRKRDRFEQPQTVLPAGIASVLTF